MCHQHAEHAVRAGQRFRAIRGSDHFGRVAARFDDALDRLAGVFQVFGVDVHQRDGRVLKGGKGEDVAHQIAGEYITARADENKFFAHIL